MTSQRRLAAIMFTDIVGYSALTQQNERLAIELLEEHNSLIRPLLDKYKGIEIKTIGDAFMVEFASSLNAVRCAISIQGVLEAHNAAQPEERQIRARIGIHVGDVEHRDGDVFGDGVNIASRIEPLAAGGGICLSQQVYDQVHKQLQTPLKSIGKQQLKNIEQPLEVYRVLLPWQKGSAPSEGKQPSLKLAKLNWAVGAVGMVIVLTVAGWWVLNSTAPTTEAAIQSIAVLPFLDLSPEQTLANQGFMIADNLMRGLSKLEDLGVPSFTSVIVESKKNKTLKEMAWGLGVEVIVEGNVQEEGNHQKISADLILVADETRLWSGTYTTDRDNLKTIQVNIAVAIATVLNREFIEEWFEPETANSQALTLYKQGRFLWEKQTREGTEQSIELFKQALELDPAYALAHTGLADSYIDLSLPREEAYSKTKEHVEKALNLDSSLSEAYVSQGRMRWIFERDLEGAKEAFEHALKLNPSNGFAHSYYGILLNNEFGLRDEAIAQLYLAAEYNPLSSLMQNVLGQILWSEGRVEEAILQFENTLDLEPKHPYARRQLARVLRYLGEWDRAEAELQESIELNPNDPVAYYFYGEHLQLQDRFAEAIEQFQKALQLNPSYSDALIDIAWTKRLIYDWEGAEEAYKQALQVDPDNSGARRDYAWFYLLRGQQDQARQEVQQALDTEPDSAAANHAMGEFLYRVRDFKEARVFLQKALETNPAHVGAHFILAIINMLESRYEEALAQLQEAEANAWVLDEFNFLWREAVRGYTYARMGQEGKAQRVLNELLQLPKKPYLHLSLAIAIVYAGLEDVDHAFEWLEKAYDEHDALFALELRTDPLLDVIRTDPRYIELLHKLGLAS